MTDTKTVGVIGGLGPVATLDFFDRILKRTRAINEQDHLRLIIDNNTKIPDRNAHSRGEGPSPADALAASARGLEQAGAEVIVNLSASNELVGKTNKRRRLIGGLAGQLICGYVYASAGKGESSADVIYGGHQMVAALGRLTADRAPHVESAPGRRRDSSDVASS